MSDAAITQLLSRLEAVAARLESVEKQLQSGGGAGAGAASAPAASGEVSKAVADFDNLVSTYIDEYVNVSAKIDPLVKQQADLVKQAVQAQRDLLYKASQSKKPDAGTFASLLKPTSDLMGKIVAIRDSNRASKVFGHLSTISEGISALGWVAMPPTPGPFVDEARASSEFYSNKLLMQYRKDESAEGKTQVAWVTAWNTFLKELRAFIKTYHTTDLTWNAQGGDVSKVATPAAAAPASTSGGPPPPPAAGPPPPPVVDLSAAGSGGGSSHAALFAEINAVKERQAGGKTAGLKHVTKDMKTKNQEKTAAVVPAVVAAKKPAAAAAPKLGPPKFELDGAKWKIENQVGNKNIVIENPETRHTVYIYKCFDSVIQIKGKVNSIMLDSCKKTGLVFENAISVAEVVNCSSVQVQCTGKVPSVAIDKTSGCQVFLSAEGFDTEVVTSKSDEMNVVLPGLNPNDDIIEIPIPEQFRTLIKDRKLVTEAVAHSG
jgi:adenylyl cyclase-associated protein